MHNSTLLKFEAEAKGNEAEDKILASEALTSLNSSFDLVLLIVVPFQVLTRSAGRYASKQACVRGGGTAGLQFVGSSEIAYVQRVKSSRNLKAEQK